MTFCPDYYEAPERYEIENEEFLKSRYKDIQLRDTSDLRLNNLCLTDEAGYPVTGAAVHPK